MAPQLAPSLLAALGDRYSVRQTLGGGGMSSTYIVDEVALGRQVVLKVLPPHLADGISVERFEREIQLAARLQHAFVVPVLAAGVVNGAPWYTMPLVNGDSLRTRLTREGAMPATAVARVLRDVAEALAYAHGQGVIHRDIKPDNVLLAGAHALVTDFGVAKALASSNPRSATMTHEGVAIGTPAYMAPEQAAADPSVDGRADLYSLGAMGYEMLSGRPVFGDRPPMQQLAAHATERPTPLATLAPTAPSELTTLIERLLAKHPNDRPTHAQDVADALGAMLSRWSSGGTGPSSSRFSVTRAATLWLAAFVSVSAVAWIAVRWLPVPEWTFPAAVLLMLAGVPVVAVSLWLHRPAREVDLSPSIASRTTLGRLEAAARPHLSTRRALRLGGLAVLILALVAAAWGVSRQLGIGPAATLRSSGVLTVRDRVLVGDFVPPPGDSSLGRLVGDLLRTEIGRSQSLPLVTQQMRAGVLRSMVRPVTIPITGDVEIEVAQRVSAKVYIAGTVSTVGGGYVLQAQIIETATGRELESFRERASSGDGIVDAVDHMGRQIRNALGANLREVRSAPQLNVAMTPSLEALRLYSTAAQRGGVDFIGNIALLERAVAIDTDFAEAYRALAQYTSNVGRNGRSAWAAEQAFRHRAPLTPYAQRMTEGTYYSRATRDHDDRRATDAYLAALEISPRSTTAMNNLALQYLVARDPHKALAMFKRAIAIDTVSTFVPHSILRAYWAAGHADEARRYMRESLRRWQPKRFVTAMTEATMHGADLDVAGAAAIADTAIAGARARGEWVTAAVNLSAAAAAALGRVTVIDQLRQEHHQEGPADDPSVWLSAITFDWIALEAGPLNQPVRAHAVLDSLVAAHPPTPTAGAADYDWLRVSELYGLAGDATRATHFIQAFERVASPGQRVYFATELGLAKGWAAIAAHRYDDAITAFRSADVGACMTCALPPLAHAYDLAGHADSAIAVLERYLATSDFQRLTNTDWHWLAGTYKRLGELYEARGDTARALRYDSRFVELWKNADPALQPSVREVKRKIELLRSRSG